MITTAFLLMLISFELFYICSKQFKPQTLTGFVPVLKAKPASARLLASAAFMLAMVLLIICCGWMSGVISAIVALMAAGSLVVLLHPFQYLGLRTIIVLYIILLSLEILI